MVYGIISMITKLLTLSDLLLEIKIILVTQNLWLRLLPKRLNNGPIRETISPHLLKVQETITMIILVGNQMILQSLLDKLR